MKYNVLLIYSSQSALNGAFYRFYGNIVKELNKKSFDITLYSCCLIADGCLILNNYEKSIQLPNKTKYFSYKNLAVLKKFILSNRINVVLNLLLPNIDISIFILVLKRKCGFKVLNHIHSMPNVIKKNSNYISYLLIKDDLTIKDRIKINNKYLFLLLLSIKEYFVNIFSYSVSDRVVLLSNRYVKEYLSVLLKKKSLKVLFAPNPFIMPSSLKIRPILEREKNIVFVGRISKEKGVDLLLKIWIDFYAKHTEWNLIFVGSGDMFDFYKKNVLKYNICNVRFVGYQTNPFDFIVNARILCLTSIFEGLPSVILEAMSVGTVPVCFDSFSACYEMITNMFSGVIVPAFDIESYKRSLFLLAENETLLASISDNALSEIDAVSVYFGLCISRNIVV